MEIETAIALVKEPLMCVHVCESLFHSCTLTTPKPGAPMDATLVPSPDMDTIVPLFSSLSVPIMSSGPIRCHTGVFVWSY